MPDACLAFALATATDRARGWLGGPRATPAGLATRMVVGLCGRFAMQFACLFCPSIWLLLAEAAWYPFKLCRLPIWLVAVLSLFLNSCRCLAARSSCWLIVRTELRTPFRPACNKPSLLAGADHCKRIFACSLCCWHAKSRSNRFKLLVLPPASKLKITRLLSY